MSKSSELIPNSFQVPNFIVDRLLPHLSGPEAKLLMLLCRKTFGWHKREDVISFGQFQNAAGVSRSSAIDALRVFTAAGLIGKVSKGPREINAWSLNLEADPDCILANLLEERAKTGPKLVQPADQSNQRTSATGGLVQPADQNWSAQRSGPSPTGGPTINNKTNKPMSNGSGKWDIAVEEAFDFFRTTHHKGPQYEFSRERRLLGIDGLKKARRFAEQSGSEEPDKDALALLKIAIERMRDDGWHNGKDSGVKYLDWEQLFTSKTYKHRKLVDYWLNEDNLAKWGAA